MKSGSLTLRKLLRSTPLRLTTGLVALFAFVSLVSLGATYFIVRDTLENAMQNDIALELASFQTAQSAQDVGRMVDARAQLADPDERLFGFIARDGQQFGNSIIAKARDEFQIVTLPDRQDAHDGPYLVRVVNAQGGLLMVAVSREQISDLGELFLNILLLSLLPTTVIALSAGMFIAQRSTRRIDTVNSVLNNLGQGDLAARISNLPGRPDDISDIAEQVDKMAKAQQSSVTALKQVSADIAHDLKTPIQRVSVLLNQAQEVGDLPKDVEDILHRASLETDSIVATFHSLLQIAQIEGGSPKGRFQDVDLGQLADNLVELYAPSAEENGRKLLLDLPDSGPHVVSGEKALLGQVFANLIENAIRHTQVGAQITVGVKRNGARIELTVADNGSGIPVAERDNVLRRLYRLEKSRTTPGNGLGLSLVAVIADLHDATLELASNSPGLLVKLVFGAAPNTEK